MADGVWPIFFDFFFLIRSLAVSRSSAILEDRLVHLLLHDCPDDHLRLFICISLLVRVKAC